MDRLVTRLDLRQALAGPLPRLLLLEIALYAAYGSESPFLPSFLSGRGLSPSEIGFLFAAGTVVRIGVSPAAGFLADKLSATRAILGGSALMAGCVSFLYLAGSGFWPLVGVALLHAVATASLSPLSNALVLGAASRDRSFQYGWVRGAGSAAFVAGTLTAGRLVGAFGFDSVIVASGLFFLAMAASVIVAPATPGLEVARPTLADAKHLLSLPAFRLVTLVAALVTGSHALNETFAVIRWREAGLGPGAASLLWSVAVVSEVVVFLGAGAPLLARLGPARAAMLSAGAGIVRWAIMATTVELPFAVFAQALHGLTFALLHLVAMQVIADFVPPKLAATAQTLYGSVGLGIASVVFTAGSGALYANVGAVAFWAMAGVCAASLPLAARLPRVDSQTARPA